MTVVELARKSGVAPHVVRYYTRRGLLRPVSNSRNAYKIYAHVDVARLKFIRQAQSLGFTLKEIAHIFAESGKRKSPCPMVREIVQRRVEENRDELGKLMRLQTRIEKALVQWSKMSDGVPDGDSVCRLIESVAENAE
jgi:DNA-binding transcriptional MerR regulator